MQTIKFVYWEDDGAYIGYLQDYPDYWTQGETLDDLKDHLRDLYKDLTSGAVPSIRHLSTDSTASRNQRRVGETYYQGVEQSRGKLQVISRREAVA